MKTAVFTIASRNYFAFVRTLMQSLEASNPNWDRHVVVVDEIGEEFESLPRNFDLISLDDLDLPEADKMKFRYTILEFNTAVKPYAILTLFKEYDRVLYIDPDIFVYEKMKEVEDAFNKGYNFVLTPHFTGLWKEDGCMPDEPAIMISGVYNLGFIGLKKCDDTIEMVKWWADKLEKKCVVDIPAGIFVDQKWIDLVPGRYDNVFILRHEGYNVAYWNLSHRKASKKGGKFYFNGQPLIFFHFSGFNPRNMESISKHQNRHTMKDIGVAKELFEKYAKKALSNEFDMWKKFKYAYANFSDGRVINELFRYAYRNNEDMQRKCGNNPFDRSDVFYEKEKPFVIDYMLKYIWRARPDLQHAFPNPASQEYLNWANCSVEREYGLESGYITGVSMKVEEQPTPVAVPVVARPSLRHRFKEFLRKIMPAPIWKIGKKIYRTFKPWKEPEIFTVEVKQPEVLPQPEVELKEGVNLIGYIRSEHGVGEACRLTASSLNQTTLDWLAYDYEVGNPSRQEDRTWDSKISDEIKYNVSIFNVNADQMPVAMANVPKEVWNAYKIGVWYWELMEFPDMWCDSFNLVDEIWAPTRFIQECLQKKAPCPVLYMAPGIEREQPEEKYNRAYFNLPEKAFLFLNMFDSFSFSSRKNPTAAVEAFKKAFKPNDTSVGMVIKINNLKMLDEHAKEFEELKGEYKNIYIMAETLSRAEVNGLMNCCDVAVSLHRSEGLGLLCEEAMYYGKPVIATGWSGNMDFMTKENSCLVDYELKEIGEDIGPYEKWQKWADADVAQATEYMKKLYKDKSYYERISKMAKKDMREKFSHKVCGEKMEKRIKEIQVMMKK